MYKYISMGIKHTVRIGTQEGRKEWYTWCFCYFYRVCKGKLKAKGELSAKEVSDVSLYSIYSVRIFTDTILKKYISINAWNSVWSSTISNTLKVHDMKKRETIETGKPAAWLMFKTIL